MKLSWSEIESILHVAQCNVLIHGGPSLGKSFVAQSLGGYAITIHDGTPADELRGHWVPQGGGFAWHDGIAVKAWTEGVPLVINEIDKGSDEVRSILHVIADNPETAKISLPTNHTVRPLSGFRIVATMNGLPEDLPDALRSRFPVVVFVDEPHPGAIAKLPKGLQEYARNSAVAGNVNRRIHLRSWYAFAELSPLLGEELAVRAVFGTRSGEISDALKLAKYGAKVEPEAPVPAPILAPTIGVSGSWDTETCTCGDCVKMRSERAEAEKASLEDIRGVEDDIPF